MENLHIIYSCSSISSFLYICVFGFVDSTNQGLCSTVVIFFFLKKIVYKYTCEVQTCIVEGSTIDSFLSLILDS